MQGHFDRPTALNADGTPNKTREFLVWNYDHGPRNGSGRTIYIESRLSRILSLMDRRRQIFGIRACIASRP